MKYHYCDNQDSKELAAKYFKSQLRKVAKELGLQKGDYDLRFIPGGPAIWGEVVLRSDSYYIQASHGHDMGVLVRTCKGRKDYGGGRNNYIPNVWLTEPAQFADRVREVTYDERFARFIDRVRLLEEEQRQTGVTEYWRRFEAHENQNGTDRVMDDGVSVVEEIK